MDDPVPVRRAAVGCLLIAALVAGLMLLVRPTIFTLAPARDDGSIVVATATELAETPIRRHVILTRSRGWAGEADAADGRVQVTILVTAAPALSASAVNAWSPGADGCAVEVAERRLVDCAGRTWSFHGTPLDATDALERFPATIENGSVVVDMTRTIDD